MQSYISEICVRTLQMLRSIGATKEGASAKRLTELVSRFVSHILNQSYKISAEKGQLCLEKGKPRTAVVQCLFTRTQSKTASMAIQGYELNDRHAVHVGNVNGAALRTASAPAQSSSLLHSPAWGWRG